MSRLNFVCSLLALSAVDEKPPDLTSIRKNYRLKRLRRTDLLADPMAQFSLWLDDAFRSGLAEPNAMSLATASKGGLPLVRTVLLRGVMAGTFIFFTNLESRKACQLAENPKAALLFLWLALERQVIVTGLASRLPTAEVARYFAARPRESQLSAWASPQSSEVSSREFLENRWEEMNQRFAQVEVPLPSFWGGYQVEPETIEFWQGGPHRLHDRFEYTRQAGNAWTIARLAP